MTVNNKRTSAGATVLSEEHLDKISGGPARRTESFGDPVGNYNFKVEIEGVSQETGVLKKK